MNATTGFKASHFPLPGPVSSDITYAQAVCMLQVPQPILQAREVGPAGQQSPQGHTASQGQGGRDHTVWLQSQVCESWLSLPTFYSKNRDQLCGIYTRGRLFTLETALADYQRPYLEAEPGQQKFHPGPLPGPVTTPRAALQRPRPRAPWHARPGSEGGKRKVPREEPRGSAKASPRNKKRCARTRRPVTEAAAAQMAPAHTFNAGRGEQRRGGRQAWALGQECQLPPTCPQLRRTPDTEARRHMEKA